jgi:hypothetical protein
MPPCSERMMSYLWTRAERVSGEKKGKSSWFTLAAKSESSNVVWCFDIFYKAI